MRFITKITLAATLSLASAGFVQAACNSTTDAFGNTSVRCSDGTTGNLYTDSFGNTTGRIGDKRVNTYSDSFGNTSGSIGNDRVNTYTDSFGNTINTDV